MSLDEWRRPNRHNGSETLTWRLGRPDWAEDPGVLLHVCWKYCTFWEPGNYQTSSLENSLLETLAVLRNYIFKPRKLVVENQMKLVNLAVEIGDSSSYIRFHSH